jgi:hypothetical protein
MIGVGISRTAIGLSEISASAAIFSSQHGIGRVNAIDCELIGREVGILFDPLALVASILEDFVFCSFETELRIPSSIAGYVPAAHRHQLAH